MNCIINLRYRFKCNDIFILYIVFLNILKYDLRCYLFDLIGMRIFLLVSKKYDVEGEMDFFGFVFLV